MKKIYFLAIAFFVLSVFPNRTLNAQGIGINTAGAAPDSSAALDINFNNKGVLIPRLTTAQRNAINNPATGLQIYNTDCNVYNYNAGTPASPNWATLFASNAIIAGVSIVANPVGAFCAGTTVTFSAVPAAGVSSPNYQWQLNGNNVGSNSSLYSSNSLNSGDIVTCILSSAAPCVAGSPATSNALTMIVNPVPSTPGSISGNTTPCPLSTGNVYTIGPVTNANSYTWSIPSDATITSGAGTTSITVTFGYASGNITVAGVNGCETGSASSQAINLFPNPTVANAGANQGVAYPGTSTTLAANTPSVGTGVWRIVSGAGGSISDTTNPASNFSGASGTSYVLSWTISSNTCDSSTTSDVNITFLPQGCALASDLTVWCTTTNPNITGADLCGYPDGYAGTYYAITDAGAAALGMTVYSYIDCASNYVYGGAGYTNEIAGWTGPPDCYTLQQSWGRYEGNTGGGDWPVVRCTDYE